MYNNMNIGADAIVPPNNMYFLLKKQSKLLPPTESIGILLHLWQNLENICEITTSMPIIEHSSGFTFISSINRYIVSGKASVLMLVDDETKTPCAVLVFTYIPSKWLYIDYLDGDKNRKGECGGGATYLLWHFCKCVDNITSPGYTIPIQLMDAADDRTFYNKLFGDRDHEDHRGRTSNAITYTDMTGKPPTLSRQSSILLNKEPTPITGSDMILITRGLDEVKNLRNYNIIRRWNLFTGEIARIHNCNSIKLRLNLKKGRDNLSILNDGQDNLSILNDLLIKSCKINDYSSAVRYFKSEFNQFEQKQIIMYIRKKYPILRHGWANTFLHGVNNDAGKIRIKTKKRKGRRILKTRSKK